VRLNACARTSLQIMASNRMGRKTAPGFADPNAHVSVGDAAKPAANPTAPSTANTPAAASGNAATGGAALDARQSFDRKSNEASRNSKTPLVEVEVSYERGSAPRTDSMKRVYEVWTNNHVYSLDSRMNCIEVRATGGTKLVTDHPFLGARLVGGQVQDEGSVEMSYPLPRPGAFAVFESRRGQRRQFSRTSTVTRVVLRLRIVSVTDRNAVPSWEDVSAEG
jgi:hypothetical protein